MQHCAMQLDNWTPDAAVSTDIRVSGQDARPATFLKHTIELPVPPGQTDIAVRLLKGMYQKAPSVSDLTQEQLLQLVLLADRFGVPKVQAAVLDEFKDVQEDQLSWDIAIALLDLPISCEAQPGYKRAVRKAEKKLLQKLGDLEVVWSDRQLQDALLSLPHAALLRLVRHETTRVAAESTVVYTILQWSKKHEQGCRDSNVQHLKQLMQQVRLQHLSQLYITTFMMKSETVLLCYSMYELAIACTGTDPASRKALQDVEYSELKAFPSWTANKRPASSKEQLIEWKIPLTELRDAVNSTLSSKAVTTINSTPQFLQGRTLKLSAEVSIAAGTTAAANVSSSAVDMQLGLYVKVLNLPEGNVCNVTADLTVLSFSHYYNVYLGPLIHGFHSSSAGRGYSQAIELKSIGSWSDAEKRLKQKYLVHDDSYLHIKAAFSSLT